MNKSRGYTLIELVIVMILLAIIGAVSFVAIGSYKNHYLRVAAERLSFDLNYAKNNALIATVWTGATIQSGASSGYTLFTTDGVTDTNMKLPQDSSKDFVVSLSGDYPGITVSAVNIASGAKIEFSPSGVPYNDKNGAALAADGTITLSNGTSTVTVVISAGTGRVYIQ